MKHFSRISIMEAGAIINRKDREAIVSWLIANSIRIYNDRQPFVYRIEVEMQVLKPLILDCKRCYPNLWKEKLKIICDGNKQLCDLFLIELDNDHSLSTPTTRIKPKNKEDVELLNRIYR
jgi:hypothetical protein